MLVLPIGTQIVSRTEVRGPDGVPRHPAGAVGTITGVPADASHSYRIRFPDGFEASLSRFDVMALQAYQQSAVGGNLHPLDEFDLKRHVIYRCVIGSRAYGLDHEGSDTDRRGMHWSLWGVPEQLEDSAMQECYWELQKVLTLALKANPNVLECLYSPLVEEMTPLAAELIAGREMFLSKLVYQTYNGYVMSQFKKLQQDLRTRGEVKWKHVMHLIRLLLAGISILRDGVLEVRVEKFRAELLAIRDGRMKWEEIDAWRVRLHGEFDAAFAGTRLPERPDYERANAFLLKARRSMVTKHEEMKL